MLSRSRSPTHSLNPSLQPPQSQPPLSVRPRPSAFPSLPPSSHLICTRSSCAFLSRLITVKGRWRRGRKGRGVLHGTRMEEKPKKASGGADPLSSPS